MPSPPAAPGRRKTARLDRDFQDRQQLSSTIAALTMPLRPSRGRSAGSTVQPLGDEAERAAGVLLHRLQHHHQLPGDLLVAPDRGQQPQHPGNEAELVDHIEDERARWLRGPRRAAPGQQEGLVGRHAAHLSAMPILPACDFNAEYAASYVATAEHAADPISLK